MIDKQHGYRSDPEMKRVVDTLVSAVLNQMGITVANTASYKGKVFIAHPDMDPHYYDGKNFVKLEFTENKENKNVSA